MSNEEKILSMLEEMKTAMKNMQSDIEILKEKKLDSQSIKRQLETLNEMRHLLTKEEADAVEAAVGEKF